MKDGPETPTDDVKSLSGLLNHQDGGGVSTILMVMSGVRPGRLNAPVVFLSALPFPVTVGLADVGVTCSCLVVLVLVLVTTAC